MNDVEHRDADGCCECGDPDHSCQDCPTFRAAPDQGGPHVGTVVRYGYGGGVHERADVDVNGEFL